MTIDDVVREMQTTPGTGPSYFVFAGGKQYVLSGGQNARLMVVKVDTGALSTYHGAYIKVGAVSGNVATIKLWQTGKQWDVHSVPSRNWIELHG